jgi:hypothetical protein
MCEKKSKCSDPSTIFLFFSGKMLGISPAALPPAVWEGSEGVKKSVAQNEFIDRSPHLRCLHCGKALRV